MDPDLPTCKENVIYQCQAGNQTTLHASDSQSNKPFSKSMPQTVIEKINVKTAGEQFNHPLLVWPDDEMNVQAWPETFVQVVIVLRW